MHRHRTRKLIRKVVRLDQNTSWKIELDDPALLCTDLEYCNKKKPHLHSMRTGHCTIWPEGIIGPDRHSKCPGIFTTRGGQKTVYCKCECHQ